MVERRLVDGGLKSGEIEILNQYLEGLSGEDRLLWAVDEVGLDRVIFTTSGGTKAPVLPYFLREHWKTALEGFLWILLCTLHKPTRWLSI